MQSQVVVVVVFLLLHIRMLFSGIFALQVYFSSGTAHTTETNQYIHMDIRTYYSNVLPPMCTPTTNCNNKAERSCRSNTHMPQISKIYENFIFIRFCAYWSKPMAPNYVLLLHAAAATEHIWTNHEEVEGRAHRGAYIFHKVPKFTVESFQIIATPTGFSKRICGQNIWMLVYFIRSVGIVYMFYFYLAGSYIYYVYTKNMWIFFLFSWNGLFNINTQLNLFKYLYENMHRLAKFVWLKGAYTTRNKFVSIILWGWNVSQLFLNSYDISNDKYNVFYCRNTYLKSF